MKLQLIPMSQLVPAPWNPNEASDAMLLRLSRSIDRFGLVVPLLVRPLADDRFEVLSGNQRLRVLIESSSPAVPCIVQSLGDADARLLAEALNAVHGEDDLVKKVDLLRHLLQDMSSAEVAAILPEPMEFLSGLQTLSEQDPDAIASALRPWEEARRLRLERVSFPFSQSQRQIVEEAITRALPERSGDEPNRRALALVRICSDWLQKGGDIP